MQRLEDFYARRRVLITGHTGFKGAWLASWLGALGAEVHGYALEPDTDPSLFSDARLGTRMASSRIGDVRDLAHLSGFLSDVQPEVIFHLAAQPLVRLSYEIPVETFATNVLGTVHCLEAARHCESVGAVVVVTSDKCYEPPPPRGGYSEDSAMGGHDPYSASKGAAELAVASYRRSFFGGDSPRGLASARGGNVVGGGDWSADRLVPDIIRSVLRGEPVEIRRPEATRPWQHVLDALLGYLMLGRAVFEEPVRYSRGWNFGPPAGEVVTVRALSEQLFAALGRGEARYATVEVGPHEAADLTLNCSAARSELDWSPRLSQDETVRWTASWYRDWERDPEQAHQLMLDQIEAISRAVA